MKRMIETGSCESDIRVQAFVDDELPPRERQRFLEDLERDAELREKVCRMRMTKEWVRQAFEEVEPPPARPAEQPIGAARCRFGTLAASLLLFAAGALAGAFCLWEMHPVPTSVVLKDVEAAGNRVVLHLAESDPDRFRLALDEAEELLERYAQDGVRVEVLTNAGGIDLLRADVSPFVRRVAGLMQKYDGRITFIACANAIRRVEEKGRKVILLDKVRTDTTAVDHIIHRLKEGWAYVKI